MMENSKAMEAGKAAGFPRMRGAFLILGSMLALAGCANQPPEVIILMPESDGATHAKMDFKSKVAPVLQSKCVTCHYDHAQLTGLSFQRRENLIQESAKRPILVPGEPDKSTLFLVTVMPDYFVEAMPPSGHRLTDAEAFDLYIWIAQGAEWPENIVLKPPPDA